MAKALETIGLVGEEREAVATKSLADPQREELLLDTISALFDHYQGVMAAARSRCNEVLNKGRDTALLDLTFGVPARNIRNHLLRIEQTGLTRVANLIRQQLFPQGVHTAADINKLFYGADFDPRYFTIGDHTRDCLNHGTNSVLVTGSPAGVTMEQLQQNHHHHIFQQVGRINDLLFQRQLPTAGVCYFHQVAAASSGGKVETADSTFKGLHQIETFDPETVELWQTLFGGAVGMSLEKYLHNTDIVTTFNEKVSKALLRLGPAIQALINIDGHGVEFNGDIEHDIALIKELMRLGRHTKFTVQGHPELTFIYSLIELVLNPEFQDIDYSGTAQFLNAQTSFFEQSLN